MGTVTANPTPRSRPAGGGGGGTVVGPASSVDGHLALFDGTGGDLLKDGGALGVYLGAMSWATLQTSAYANGSVELAALPADASVFVTDWGVAMTPNQARTFWTCAHPITLDQFSSAAAGTDVVYTANGSSASAVASASGGAATRVTHTGHGLTSANNGVSVYVSAGTGWTPGLYPMTYVDANTYDLAVPWDASFGAPTVRAANGSTLRTLLRSVTIPAGLMQARSALESSSAWQMTSSANEKNVTALFSGAIVLQLFPSSVSSYFEAGRITRNRALKNAQIGPQHNLSPSNGGSPRFHSIDTELAQTFEYHADLRVVNEYMRLAGATLLLHIGQ